MENYGVDFIARCIAGEALDKASSGSGITVDSELSTTSTNPVQNKVITNALNNVHIDVDAALSTTSENPVQNKVITEEVNSKPTCVNTSGTKVYGQKIVQLTKAQYDAIASKDANTYYMITDDASDEQYTAGDGIDITNGVISLDVQYGASLEMTINPNTYVLTATLKDQDGSTLGTAQTIDLPLETMVVGGNYDDTTKKVILTLQNGTTIEFSVADLVSGLESSAHAASTYQTIAGMSNYATQTDIADMATETWVGQQGYLTSADEVPSVGSSDDGKVLTASYSGGVGSYSWETASSGTSDYTQLSNKPAIDGTTLTSASTASGLGLATTTDIADMATETWVINQAFETSAHAASTYQTVTAMSNYVTQSDISDMATETWVGQQGFLTSADEVPTVGSSDDGKVLTASYSGGTGSYSWQAAASGGLSVETDGTNYWITVNGIRLYFASSAPTGTIPDGSIGIGW